MMNRISLLFVISTLLLCATFALPRTGFSQAKPVLQQPDARSEWVGKCMREIKMIKVGSTQQDFNKLFAVIGGLSDGKTYSYRKCPYIHLTAEFKNGKVVKISRSYLEEVFYD